MEIITEFVQNQLSLVVPVGLAIFGCIFLFTYAIRPAKQPKFKLSGLDDRKTAGKKKKPKEKKTTANGHVSTGLTKGEKSPLKELKKSSEAQKKEKKVESLVRESKKEKTEVTRKFPEPQENKKKANKKPAVAKPVDFDEGNWETVPSKAEKKRKIEQAPVKKDKKIKTQSDIPAVQDESPEIAEEQPTVEEVEAEIEETPELIVEEVKATEEPAPIIEEKKDKKKKKPKAIKSQQEEAVEAVPKVVEASEPATPPEEESEDAPASTGAAFDELGDTWREAKAVKKSKKKARRDN